MRIRTDKYLAAGGDAVARAEDGRVVFIEGAAPLELVDADIVKANKRFLRAKLRTVVEASSERVTPECEHFGTCGGCQLQHVSPAAQLESKERIVLESVARIGGVERGSFELVPSGAVPPYGYRTRARLVVGKGLELGYRQHRSNKIVEVLECSVLHASLQRVVSHIRACLGVHKQSPPGGGVVEIEMVSGGSHVQVQLPRRLASLAPELERLDSVSVGVEASTEIYEDFDDGFGPLRLSPTAFSQASEAGNIQLLEALRALLELKTDTSLAVELFSGNGNLTRVLQRSFKRVVCIESYAWATELHIANKPAHVEVQNVPVADALLQMVDDGVQVPFVLLDPPRRGLEVEEIAPLRALAPSTIVYVSCDPSTFARDLRIFLEDGYRLSHLQPLDLYPETPHVELVARLVRAL